MVDVGPFDPQRVVRYVVAVAVFGAIVGYFQQGSIGGGIVLGVAVGIGVGVALVLLHVVSAYT
jgi:uncharacterized membrane protein (UPF0136 family)